MYISPTTIKQLSFETFKILITNFAGSRFMSSSAFACSGIASGWKLRRDTLIFGMFSHTKLAQDEAFAIAICALWRNFSEVN